MEKTTHFSTTHFSVQGVDSNNNPCQIIYPANADKLIYPEGFIPTSNLEPIVLEQYTPVDKYPNWSLQNLLLEFGRIIQHKHINK